MTDNVIEFPKLNDIPCSKELGEELAANKKKYVDEIISHYGAVVLNRLAYHGIDITHDSFMYDYLYIMDQLKAITYNTMELDHDLYEKVVKDCKKYYKVDVD